jgi:hypothetical protein
MLRLTSTMLRAAAAAKRERAQIERLQHRSQHELESMSTDFRWRVESVLRHLAKKGWVPVVFHGRRSEAEQAKKVAAGYSATMKSFHLASTAIPHQSLAFNYVVKGEAADIVDARYLWSGPAKDLKFAFWTDLGGYAKVAGLTWGGNWSKPDVAHVQLTHMETSQEPRVVV